MTNTEKVREILEQVVWYGFYWRSGGEPEDPTLSPEQAQRQLDHHYAKEFLEMEMLENYEEEKIYQMGKLDYDILVEAKVRNEFRQDIKQAITKRYLEGNDG